MHWNMHFLDLQRLYVFWTIGLTTALCNSSLVPRPDIMITVTRFGKTLCMGSTHNSRNARF